MHRSLVKLVSAIEASDLKEEHVNEDGFISWNDRATYLSRLAAMSGGRSLAISMNCL